MKHRGQTLKGKRIAFLAANLHSGSSLKLWHPLVDEAQRAGVELFLFPGGRLSAWDGEEALKNRLFDYVAENVDGVVSWASSLGGYVGKEALNSFHQRFSNIPLVAMAHRIPGRPTIRIDAYSGMIPLLRHLYDVHGERRFAFIAGPAEHESAADRLRAFEDFHALQGLPFDPRLVSSPFSWNEGVLGLKELVDQRNLVPGRDFDVLLAASDLQLYDAVQLLQERGYLIPQELRVAGFNDSAESRIIAPTFTTVRLPFEEQSTLAFRNLLSLLNHETVPEEQTLQCSLVLRRSCACLSSSVQKAGQVADPVTEAMEFQGSAGRVQLRKRLLDCMDQVIQLGVEERIAWLHPLADAFLSALEGMEIPFLQTLERIMDRQIRLDRDIFVWQDVLSALKKEARCCIAGEAALSADRIMDQARVVVGEAAARMYRLKEWESEWRGHIIRDLEKDLIRVQKRSELSAILASRLNLLGIEAVYIVEERKEDAFYCIAGYGPGSQLIPEGEYQCAHGALIPKDVFGSHPGTSWVVEPLCGNGRFFGWMLLRLGIRDGTIYEELRRAVSSTLLGLGSIDLIRKARADAERAEKLKAGFLANVSAEFLEPLREIEDAADRILTGSPKDLHFEAEAVRTLARKQLSLTQEILELSRAEVGELALDLRISKPLTLFQKARHILAKEGKAAWESVVGLGIQSLGAALPLILGDEDRLSRVFATILKDALDLDLNSSLEAGALILSFSISYAKQDFLGIGASASRTLAHRVIAAHGGILEEDIVSDTRLVWTLRLPLPNLGDQPPSFKAGNAMAILSQEHARPSDLPCLDPASVLADPNRVGDVGMFILDMALLSDNDVPLVLHFSKHPILSKIPCAVLNAPFSELEYTGLSSFFRSAMDLEHNKALIVYDPDPESRRLLISSLSSLPASEIHIMEKRDDLDTRVFRSGGTVFLVRGLDMELFTHIKTLTKSTERPILIFLVDTLKASEAFHLLCAEPRVLLINEGILTTLEMEDLLSKLLRGDDLLPPYTGMIVKNALLYLNKNFGKAVLRWKLAETSHVSEDYLTRVFGKELGVSPWEYLIRLRIREAKRLLLQSSDTIGAISDAVGFTDQAYFCRIFRKLVGSPPRTYRKQGRE